MKKTDGDMIGKAILLFLAIGVVVAVAVGMLIIPGQFSLLGLIMGFIGYLIIGGVIFKLIFDSVCEKKLKKQ